MYVFMVQNDAPQFDRFGGMEVFIYKTLAEFATGCLELFRSQGCDTSYLSTCFLDLVDMERLQKELDQISKGKRWGLFELDSTNLKVFPFFV